MSRINHNIPAMITGTAVRQVGRNLSKSLEKLSTGLRINRAADDAAGARAGDRPDLDPLPVQHLQEADVRPAAHPAPAKR
mgnify:CR=1 FL=1